MTPSKVPGADGNVYWAPSINNASDVYRQRWTFTEVDDGNLNPPTGGGQRLVLPYTKNYLNASYLNKDYEIVREGIKHYGVDFIGKNNENGKQEYFTAAGDGTVVGVHDVAHGNQQHWLGNVLAVRYEYVLRHTDNAILRNVIFRYCHLEEIYVTEGQEVNIHTLLAKRGMTGQGADATHLHLEASLNGDDPFTTPSEPDEDRGNYQLIDPLTVLYKTKDQQFILNGQYGNYNLVDDDCTVGTIE